MAGSEKREPSRPGLRGSNSPWGAFPSPGPCYGVGRGGRPYGGGRGRCFGGGRGAGRGFGWAQETTGGPPFAPAPDPDLAERMDDLARENEDLRARVAELEKKRE